MIFYKQIPANNQQRPKALCLSIASHSRKESPILSQIILIEV